MRSGLGAGWEVGAGGRTAAPDVGAPPLNWIHTRTVGLFYRKKSTTFISIPNDYFPEINLFFLFLIGSLKYFFEEIIALLDVRVEIQFRLKSEKPPAISRPGLR